MNAAGDTVPSLPEDGAALRALVLTLMSERDALATERDLLLTQNDRLRHLLLQLRRMRFDARSERLPEEQLQLGAFCSATDMRPTSSLSGLSPTCHP